jgi:16S rRNA (guanine966-N2)-methyltransferase
MPSKYQRGSLRIIAGRWKHRVIHFLGGDDLRPTPDAVRETLFNWLAPVIEGSNCLDLFSGSGALGFEAASRGACRVDLVDHDRNVFSQLVNTRDALSASQVHIHCKDALVYLANNTDSFNIVFLDPPFYSGIVARVVTVLERSGALKAHSLVYLETPKEDDEPNLPEYWRLYREKKTGHLTYRLYQLGEINS